MRDILASLSGTTHRFRATPSRVGNDARGGLTLLLVDVNHWQGFHCAEHMWVPLTDDLRPVCGRLGQPVEFRALVRPYRRFDGTADYELAMIEDVRAVRRGR
jgi:hypothetical protein